MFLLIAFMDGMFFGRQSRASVLCEWLKAMRSTLDKATQ
jgi:hypothetical protein